jgi:5'-nucleotidase
MHKRLHILVTNDDGIHANGIKTLWDSLKSFADLTVVAPAGPQSLAGLSLTSRSPLKIEKVNWSTDSDKIWSVSGTPADCVKMGLSLLLDKRPDLIVSGINRGDNMGRTLLYSGTVGAAIEGIMQGIPAIAFSCQDYDLEPDYIKAGIYIPTIVQHTLDHPLPEGTLLNVNFPGREHDKFKGFKMTSQSHDLWAESPSEHFHPTEKHPYYWLGCKMRKGIEIEDCDGKWLSEGYITAVPIHVGNLTDHGHLKNSRHHFEKLFHEINL